MVVECREVGGGGLKAICGTVQFARSTRYRLDRASSAGCQLYNPQTSCTIGNMSMATIPGYFTVQEAATHIGVSHSQVTRYISNELLPAIDLGHQKLIPAAKVKRFKKPPRGNPNFQKG